MLQESLKATVPGGGVDVQNEHRAEATGVPDAVVPISALMTMESAS